MGNSNSAEEEEEARRVDDATLAVDLQQQRPRRPHPLLVKLGIVETNTNDNTSASTQILATDILQHLLENNLLSELNLVLAHDAVVSAALHSGSTTNSPNHEPEESQDNNNNTNNTTRAARKNKKQKLKHTQQQDKKDSKEAPDEAQPNKRTRHIALRLYYNGADRSGLAQHVGREDDNSVEKALFQALVQSHLITDRTSCHYSRCGRTDKGVSANGQVVALHVKSAFGVDASLDADGTELLESKDLPSNSLESRTVWTIPRRRNKKKNGNNNNSSSSEENVIRTQRVLTEYAYDKILNNLLPPDVRVYGWCPVSDDFSARFSATMRTYRYFFVQQQQLFDLSLMQQGLEQLVGKHDFRNFCKMNAEAVYNFERTIHSATLVQEKPDAGDTVGADRTVCYFEIVGQAFLWHQIRCIASVLFLIGRGLESPGVVSELLNARKHAGKPSYALAEASPLVLHDCAYQNLQLGYSVQNLWSVACQQEEQWQQAILTAARLRNAMESVKDDVNVLVSDVVAFCNAKQKERRKNNWRKQTLTLEAEAKAEAQFRAQFRTKFVTWRQALDWISEQYSLVPEPHGNKETVYTPLLERCKGTTYEEKVAAIQQSTKRRERYEDNVIRKRKTKEEDAAFYEHMSKQGSGGSHA